MTEWVSLLKDFLSIVTLLPQSYLLIILSLINFHNFLPVTLLFQWFNFQENSIFSFQIFSRDFRVISYLMFISKNQSSEATVCQSVWVCVCVFPISSEMAELIRMNYLKKISLSFWMILDLLDIQDLTRKFPEKSTL